jgi:hypothetical protein
VICRDCVSFRPCRPISQVIPEKCLEMLPISVRSVFYAIDLPSTIRDRTWKPPENNIFLFYGWSRDVIRTVACAFTHYHHPGASDVAEGTLRGVNLAILSFFPVLFPFHFHLHFPFLLFGTFTRILPERYHISVLGRNFGPK